MKNKTITAFNVIVFAIIQSIIGAIFGGFVFLKLWQWFVVPVFHLPQFSLSYSIGLCLVASFLTHQVMPQKEGRSTGDICSELITKAVALPAVALLYGWILFKITIM